MDLSLCHEHSLSNVIVNPFVLMFQLSPCKIQSILYKQSIWEQILWSMKYLSRQYSALSSQFRRPFKFEVPTRMDLSLCHEHSLSNVIVNPFVLMFQLSPCKIRSILYKQSIWEQILWSMKYLSSASKYFLVFFSFFEVKPREDAATCLSVAPPNSAAVSRSTYSPQWLETIPSLYSNAPQLCRFCLCQAWNWFVSCSLSCSYPAVPVQDPIQ